MAPRVAFLLYYKVGLGIDSCSVSANLAPASAVQPLSIGLTSVKATVAVDVANVMAQASLVPVPGTQVVVAG